MPITHDSRTESLIYVIDSQPGICEFARSCLEGGGYSVRTSADGVADSLREIERPSLVVMGIEHSVTDSAVVPVRSMEKSGFDNIPLIVLLTDDSPQNQHAAGNLGANDYLVKPFTAAELLTRVRVVLRRSALTRPGGQLEVPDLVFDSWAMKIFVRGNEIVTTALEFRLLEYLARHRGQVFTRDFLLDAVWGDIRFINPRSVDACIRRIREKVEVDRARPMMVKTIRGVGYRMDATAVWETAPASACGCPACKAQALTPRWSLSGTKQGRSSAART